MNEFVTGKLKLRQATIKGILALFALFILLATISTDGLASEADARFQEAQQMFLLGDMDAAKRVLNNNLKRFPKHSPSILLMGRVHYRMNRFGTAAKYFRRLNTNTLDPDSLFEYGVSLYAQRKCGPAVRNFTRIPPNYTFKNYARFYSGTCYLQEGHSTRAIIKLRKAKGLPFLLDSLRRQLIRIAEKRVQDERSGQKSTIANLDYLVPIESEDDQKLIATSTDKAKGKPSKKSKKKKLDKPDAPPPTPESTMVTSITPGLNASHNIAENSFSDMKNSIEEETKITGSLALNSKYDGKLLPGGGQPSFSFALTGKRVDDAITGETSELKKNADTNYEVKSVSSRNKDEHYIHTEVSVGPSLSYPLGNATNMIIKYDYLQKTGTWRWSGVRKEQVQTPNITITGNVGEMDLEGGISYEELKQDGKTSHYVTTYSGKISKNLGNVTTSGSASHGQKEMPKGTDNTSFKTQNNYSLNAAMPLGKFNTSTSFSATTKELPKGRYYINWSEQEKSSFSIDIDRGFDFGLSISFGASYSDSYNFAIEGLAVGDQFVDSSAEGVEKKVGSANSVSNSVKAGASFSFSSALPLDTHSTIARQNMNFQIQTLFLLT